MPPTEKLFTTLSDGTNSYTVKDSTARQDIATLTQTVQNLGIDGLADTNISNPQNKQSLVYDAENDEWINSNAAAAEWVGTAAELEQAILDGDIEDDTNILVTDDTGSGGTGVIYEDVGTASATDVSYQRIGISGVYTEVNGTKYMQQPAQLSSSTDTVVTFTNACITTDVAIDVYSTIFGVNPKNVAVSTGQCVVTFDKYTGSASNFYVRIYIR